MSTISNVLITGGSSGIGYELSRYFARDTYRLFWVALEKDELHQAQQDLLKEFPDCEIHYLAIDLSQSDAPKAVFDWTTELNYQIDVLVNNAGIGTYGPFEQLPLERDMATIQLNMTALYYLSRLYLPQMDVNGKGHIINISSAASYVASPYLSLYGGTKAFVRHFSDGLRLELKDKKSPVKITVVCPGPLSDTPFQAKSGMQKVRTFKSIMGSTTSKEVAKDAYRGFKNGRHIVRTGWKFRVSYYLNLLVPRFLADQLILREMEEV